VTKLTSDAEFRGLPSGQYDVHCKSKGYDESIQHIVLSDTGETLVEAEVGPYTDPEAPAAARGRTQAKGATLNVQAGGWKMPISVILYRNGRPVGGTRQIWGTHYTHLQVAAQQAHAVSMIPPGPYIYSDTQFRGLPDGEYEVHFRPQGADRDDMNPVYYQEGVQRVTLSGTEETTIVAIMGPKINKNQMPQEKASASGSRTPAKGATLIVEAPRSGYQPGKGKEFFIDSEKAISVRLYQNGKQVRASKEVKVGALTRATMEKQPESARHGLTCDTEFSGLPAGEYEVRFRTSGHDEGIKHVALFDNEETEIEAEVGAKIGGKP
jgi:hypothetical protein